MQKGASLPRSTHCPRRVTSSITLGQPSTGAPFLFVTHLSMEKKTKSRIKGLLIIIVVLWVAIALVKILPKKYPWQNRCGGFCAESLGRRMGWIDGANGCAELNAMHTSRPDSWSELEMTHWYEAVTDRAESMNCDLHSQ